MRINPIIVQKYGGACLETPAKKRALWWLATRSRSTLFCERWKGPKTYANSAWL